MVAEAVFRSEEKAEAVFRSEEEAQSNQKFTASKSLFEGDWRFLTRVWDLDLDFGMVTGL